MTQQMHPKCFSIEHVITIVLPYKKISWVTHQLQDEIWQVEMHGLCSHCEVIMFVYTMTDVLHWLLW